MIMQAPAYHGRPCRLTGGRPQIAINCNRISEMAECLTVALFQLDADFYALAFSFLFAIHHQGRRLSHSCGYGAKSILSSTGWFLPGVLHYFYSIQKNTIEEENKSQKVEVKKKECVKNSCKTMERLHSQS